MHSTFVVGGRFFHLPDLQVFKSKPTNSSKLQIIIHIFKATWFEAEKFCHKRGWLLGELLSQSAEKEFAQQTQGLLGTF